MFDWKIPRVGDLRGPSYTARRDWVNIFAKWTQAQFMELSETDRANLLADLRTVVAIKDTYTFRDRLGCTIRGASAPHTVTAQSLIARFTYQPRPESAYDRIRKLLVPALREEARRRGLRFTAKTKRHQLERLLLDAGWTGQEEPAST